MQQLHSAFQQQCRLGDNCRVSINKSGDLCTFGRRTKVSVNEKCSLGQQSEFIYSDGVEFGSECEIIAPELNGGE